MSYKTFQKAKDVIQAIVEAGDQGRALQILGQFAGEVYAEGYAAGLEAAKAADEQVKREIVAKVKARRHYDDAIQRELAPLLVARLREHLTPARLPCDCKTNGLGFCIKCGGW